MSKVSLYQCYKVWEIEAPALSAKYHPRGSRLGGVLGSFDITSCAIPSDQRTGIENFAERTFLPELMGWMMAIEALPDNSTKAWAEQDFACAGSPKALNKRPLPLIYKGQPRRKRS